MPDVFLSYAHRDVDADDRIRRLYDNMLAHGWTVFWDQTLELGVPWRKSLESNLAETRCIVVLWTPASVVSGEVLHEATLALAAGKLVQARMQSVVVPDPFDAYQWAKLEKWDGAVTSPEIRKLFSAIQGMVLPRGEALTLPDPGVGKLGRTHLHLVHSCQRRSDLDAVHRARMYRIQVMLLGHPNALARVRSVSYRLDGAWRDRKQRTSTLRAGNFGFAEAANGFSVVEATVAVDEQDERIELSRFINLMDDGPDLVAQFAPGFTTSKSASRP